MTNYFEIIMQGTFIRLQVSNLAKMRAYYQSTLLAEVVDESEIALLLQVGEDHIELVSTAGGRNQQVAIQYSERKDFDAICQHLLINTDINPTLRQINNAHMMSFYDAENNYIELSYYQFILPNIARIEE